uniref:Retrovirus-related Pol polyprotein from transposon TNT 1-94 n=1 Tax=Tanacetum cinerariifolium TaxID=118510 RepID=A0A6L2NB02_TANCI|nr:retrovirus-related Pol polyprotein from transposon TNT 1-94 [Tanacetum cinerariifolium]
MQEEILQFKMQKVWVLIDLPHRKRAIGTKWVFRNKKDERGIVVKNKARLVTQGHTQEEGIDYEEVFPPVARIEAIRLFLAYASFMGFMVYQIDVKSAFLYGTIKEEDRVLVTKPHDKTPYELLHGRTPSIGFIRHFGCLVTILNTLDSLGKFDGKVDERFLVGYSISSKAFRVFNSRTRNQSNPSACVQEQFDAEKAGEEIVQQYVLFLVWSSGFTNPQNTDEDAAFDEKEREFQGTKPESEVNVSLSSSAQSKKHDNKTKKEAKGKSHVDSLIGYRNLSADVEDFSDNSINEDNAVDITYSDDEDDVGVKADFNNLETSITVRGNKKDEKGIMVRNKARLVAQGHIHEDGINYEEVFAQVARIEAIRLFLAYASFMGFMVYQIDVKSAFLYGTIEEEVYVNDITRLETLVDKKKVVVMEASIREALCLNDAEGVECDLSSHFTKYTSPALTQKVFANIRRVGKGFSRVYTPLFEGMLVVKEVGEGDVDKVHVEDANVAGVATEGVVSVADDVVPTAVNEPSIPSPTPPTPPPQPSQDQPSTSHVYLTPPQSP